MIYHSKGQTVLRMLNANLLKLQHLIVEKTTETNIEERPSILASCYPSSGSKLLALVPCSCCIALEVETLGPLSSLPAGHCPLPLDLQFSFLMPKWCAEVGESGIFDGKASFMDANTVW